MTPTSRNQWNACVVCGEQVTTRARINGFTGWQTDDSDEIVGKEVILVAHPECWLRVGPEEQQRLLSEHASTPT